MKGVNVNRTTGLLLGASVNQSGVSNKEAHYVIEHYMYQSKSHYNLKSTHIINNPFVIFTRSMSSNKTDFLCLV